MPTIGKHPAEEKAERERERWVKNLGSGDTNTIWTVTEGRKGFCIQLNCAGEGECQNRERDGMERRRKQERKRRDTALGDWKGREGRSIIDGFVGREQNKNAPHVVLCLGTFMYDVRSPNRRMVKK